MKYVKLFENWLNEADASVIKSNPFNPDKPSQTLLADISRKDCKGDVDVIYQSIFNKLISRNDSQAGGNGIKVLVEECMLIFDEDKQKYIIDDTNSNWGFSFQGKNIPSLLKKAKNLFYLVRGKDVKLPEGGQLMKQLTGYNVPYSKCLFIMVPTTKDGSTEVDFGSGTDKIPFFEETYFHLWAGTPETEFAPFSQVVNGLLNYETNGKLVIDKPITLQEMAKELGYEVPEKYAPMQGGIKRLSK